jgi:PKD repeat protein
MGANTNPRCIGKQVYLVSLLTILIISSAVLTTGLSPPTTMASVPAHLTMSIYPDGCAGTTNPTTGSHAYECGTEGLSVSISADPAPGWEFAFWRYSASGTSPSTEVHVYPGFFKTCEAVFRPLAPSNLNVGPNDTVGVGDAAELTASCDGPNGAPSISFSWDFGDRATDTSSHYGRSPECHAYFEETVTHVYSEPGTYEVQVRVCEGDWGLVDYMVGEDWSGLCASDSATINVVSQNQPPIVSILDVGPAEPFYVGDTLYFTGEAVDSDGSIDFDSLTWKFGDGQTDSGSLVSSQVYREPDTYTVTLTACDDDGACSSDSVWVTVWDRSNQPPWVDAGPDIAAHVGEPVHFAGDAMDPDGQIVSIIWDFDDGETVSGNLSPIHHYKEEGNYAATITVWDNQGAYSSDFVFVTILSNLPPAVAASPVGSNKGQVGDTMQFVAGVVDPESDRIMSVNWQFGDGESQSGELFTSNAYKASHVYKREGNFTVTCTACDEKGSCSTDSFTVTLRDEQSAELEVGAEIRMLEEKLQGQEERLSVLKTAITRQSELVRASTQELDALSQEMDAQYSACRKMIKEQLSSLFLLKVFEEYYQAVGFTEAESEVLADCTCTIDSVEGSFADGNDLEGVSTAAVFVGKNYLKYSKKLADQYGEEFGGKLATAIGYAQMVVDWGLVFTQIHSDSVQFESIEKAAQDVQIHLNKMNEEMKQLQNDITNTKASLAELRSQE